MSRKDGTVAQFPGGKQPGWKGRLSRTRNGDVAATLHNIVLILEHDPELAGIFALDEFANRVVMKRDPPWKSFCRGEFSEIDGSELTSWLGSMETYCINAKTTHVLEAVELVARRYKFHPVRDYLRSVKWDGQPRLEAMFSTYFGSSAAGEYATKVARIFLIGAVARVMRPGCKVDTMLVLEGAQGAGKTRVTRELFGAEWYAEAMESPASKDFYQALQGRWGVEIGEMESFSKAEVNKVKQALSAQDDTFRPSYGRYARKFPRQSVFVGTTNDEHYLRDPTGARRFLPIKVGTIDVNAIALDRDQLWAEAFFLFEQGAAWHELPIAAKDEQEARFMEDSWADPLRRWLTGSYDEKHYHGVQFRPEGGVQETTTTQLLSYALGIDLARHGRTEQMRVAQIMRRLHWRQERIVRGNDRIRLWRCDVDAPKDEVPF